MKTKKNIRLKPFLLNGLKSRDNKSGISFMILFQYSWKIFSKDENRTQSSSFKAILEKFGYLYK